MYRTLFFGNKCDTNTLLLPDRFTSLNSRFVSKKRFAAFEEMKLREMATKIQI